jgi:hypothetical protein
MRRALSCSALLVVALAYDSHIAATTKPENASHPQVLQRFFATDDAGPTQYRALRRFEARNGHLDNTAWMDVWTEADASGFRYEIVGSGGLGYVRDRVFMPALETERTMWGAGKRGAITPDNYVFEDRGAEPTGLAWIAVKPRRKDVLLVNGSIFLRPEDGDLVRIEGLLSKTPSFWTRRVEIVRRYERVAGVRVPVRLESVASVLIAGKSTFTMTYEYESVNDQRVGTPTLRQAAAVIP